MHTASRRGSVLDEELSRRRCILDDGGSRQGRILDEEVSWTTNCLDGGVEDGDVGYEDLEDGGIFC